MTRTCSVEGCVGKYHAKALCKRHYYAQPEQKEKDALRRKALASRACTEPGCDQPQRAKGLCQHHYDRLPHRAASQAAYQAKPETKERAKKRKAEWKQSNPDRLRSSNEAYREKNRGRISDYFRTYAKENGDKVREWARKHTAIRRARKAGLVQPDVLHLRDLPCARCGAPGPSEVDHIVPLSWADTLPEAKVCCEDTACYQPLCRPCNVSKGNRGVWAFVPTGTVGDEPLTLGLG